MQTLDVRDPSQVGSVSKIEADLGGGLHLLVLSGIALTNWEVDTDEVQRGETHVRLGVYASKMKEWSAFVGLGSIANDETGFVFAVDTARVELDKGTGELVLVFKPALMGEPSAMWRVSYQVVATLTTVTPHIAGTITWPRSLFLPQNSDPKAVADQLEIMANLHERVTTSGGVGHEKLVPDTPGHIVKLDIGPNSCVAHYRIENPRMAVPLKVTVVPREKFVAQPGTSVAVGRVAGPDVFTLTGGAPSLDGLNFLIDQIHNPR